MHIEPGVVDGAKMILSYGTTAAAGGLVVHAIYQYLKTNGFALGSVSLAIRSLLASLLVFVFFEILPHFPVGVSEVHFILGSSLFLILGAAPAAIGLAVGLLFQSLFLAPTDLPMYTVNVTTLLIPLFAMGLVAKQMIPATTAYKDLNYRQVLSLSLTYQGGVVAWVAFWALYGQGVGAENLAAVGSFSLSYLGVVLIEPVLDLGLLYVAKNAKGLQGTPVINDRLYAAAT